MSKAEKIILSKNFSYEQPWFYNNKLALRCELGVGDGDEEYFLNAKNRASEIFNILFENGVDIFFFDHYIYDTDCDMDVEIGNINYLASSEKELLKFCLRYQKKYRHVIVRDIPFDKDDNEDLIRVNRIVCYPDKKFNAIEIINSRIDSDINPTVHFVSFENECILSIYDDRGCDIVFFSSAAFKKYYPLLEKYFLAYDLDLMKQRLAEAE